jgi:hypothetical protein
MTQRHRDTIKCAGCGNVFEVVSVSGDALLSDHPISPGAPETNMTAQGMVTVVASRGPAMEPTDAHESPAYVCPRCGRMN